MRNKKSRLHSLWIQEAKNWVQQPRTPFGWTNRVTTYKDETINSIIIGDFNLDENQKNNSQYTHHRYFDLLQSRFNDLNLIQLVKFNTWSRLVGNT